MLTVAGLIAHLQTLDQSAPVLQNAGSYYRPGSLPATIRVVRLSPGPDGSVYEEEPGAPHYPDYPRYSAVVFPRF